MAAFAKEKIIILSLIGQSKSKINISFDVWTANSDFFLLEIVPHFFTSNTYKLIILLLALLDIKNYSREEQACALA